MNNLRRVRHNDNGVIAVVLFETPTHFILFRDDKSESAVNAYEKNQVTELVEGA